MSRESVPGHPPRAEILRKEDRGDKFASEQGNRQRHGQKKTILPPGLSCYGVTHLGAP